MDRNRFLRIGQLGLPLLLIGAIAVAKPHSFQEPDPPKISVKLLSTTAAPGGAIKGTVTIQLPEGAHAYQNPPMRDYEIPLKIESVTKNVALKAKYPSGQMIDFAGAQTAAYEGEVRIPFTIVVPKKLGRHSVAIKVAYQLCNETNCWPPRDQTFKAAFKVVKAAKPVKRP